MGKLKILRLFLVLVFITLSAIRYPLSVIYAQDKIIAIVNSEVITQKDLDDFVHFMRVQLRAEYTEKEAEDKIKSMKSDLIDKLIEDRLILQEAKKDNIKIDENRVKAKIEEVRKHYGSDAAFQEALVGQGFVQADIETRIREQLLTYNIIEVKVRDKIAVSPSEVTDFYLKNAEEFKSAEQRELESLAIEDQKSAQEISDKLREGRDLGDLAREYGLTINKISVLKDGELRYDIEEVIFKLKKGEVSEPIKIEAQYYIFKLNNIIPSRQQSLAEAQDKIYAFLSSNKTQEALTKWLEEIKKRSYIKIFQE
jgi:parvulin-like peptidyl-prolyl isomerase